MKVSRRTKVGLVLGLLIVLGATGILLGPRGFRAIRYDFYETVTLPTGGQVTCWREHGSEIVRSDSAVRQPSGIILVGRGCLAARGEGLPHLHTVVDGDSIFHVIFPGAQAAQAQGGVAYIEHSRWEECSYEDEEVGRLIQDRVVRAPEFEWEAYRGSLREEFPYEILIDVQIKDSNP